MSEPEEHIWAQRKDNGERVGDWMECHGGAKFFPLDARPEEIEVDVVAHHLARINRYNGAFKLDRYSVGEHVIVMADWFLREFPDSPALAYQALHHDDCEAYIGDMIRPIKRTPELKVFSEIEDKLWRTAIAPAFSLPGNLHPLVKDADNRILVDERDQVVGRSSNNWGIDHLEPLGVQLVGLGPQYVKGRYLQLHFELRRTLGL